MDFVIDAVGALGGEIFLGGELSLRGELSLFLCLPVLVVNDRSVVAGTMKYRPLTNFPAMVQEGGEVMEHFPF